MEGGFFLEHLVRHGYDLVGDGFKDFGYHDHDFADAPAVAAAERHERVDASPAAGTGIWDAEDVGDCVAGVWIAEVERARG